MTSPPPPTAKPHTTHPAGRTSPLHTAATLTDRRQVAAPTAAAAATATPAAYGAPPSRRRRAAVAAPAASTDRIHADAVRSTARTSRSSHKGAEGSEGAEWEGGQPADEQSCASAGHAPAAAVAVAVSQPVVGDPCVSGSGGRGG